MSFYCNVLLCNANSCVKQNKNVDNRASEKAKCGFSEALFLSILKSPGEICEVRFPPVF